MEAILSLILAWFLLGFALAAMFPEPKLWTIPLLVIGGPTSWGLLIVTACKKLGCGDGVLPMCLSGALSIAVAALATWIAK